MPMGFDSPGGYNSLVSEFTQGQSASDDLYIPPAMKVRLAEKINLVHKTHYSIHDAHRNCETNVKNFSKLKSEFTQVGTNLQEMASGFGPDGYKLNAKLESLNSVLCEASQLNKDSTEHIMGNLVDICKSVQPVEPEYRKAYKQVIRAEEKFEAAVRKNAESSRIENLKREFERKRVNYDITREEYSRQTFQIGVKLLNGFSKQLYDVSRNTIDATEKLVGHIPPKSSPDIRSKQFQDYETQPLSRGSSVYEEANSSDLINPSPNQSDDILVSLPGIQVEGVPHVQQFADLEVPTRISRDTQPLKWTNSDQGNDSDDTETPWK